MLLLTYCELNLTLTSLKGFITIIIAVNACCCGYINTRSTREGISALHNFIILDLNEK